MHATPEATCCTGRDHAWACANRHAGVVIRSSFILCPRMTNTEANIPPEVAELAANGRKSLARAWREHLGLTKEQVAARMNISPAALEQIEARTAKPRRATLSKVAEALGVQVEQLIR